MNIFRLAVEDISKMFSFLQFLLTTCWVIFISSSTPQAFCNILIRQAAVNAIFDSFFGWWLSFWQGLIIMLRFWVDTPLLYDWVSLTFVGVTLHFGTTLHSVCICLIVFDCPAWADLSVDADSLAGVDRFRVQTIKLIWVVFRLRDSLLRLAAKDRR